MKGNKEIETESIEDFLKRGGEIKCYKEGKINKRELKAISEKKETVDLEMLLEKANPEQAKVLRRIAKEQNIELD